MSPATAAKAQRPTHPQRGEASRRDSEAVSPRSARAPENAPGNASSADASDFVGRLAAQVLEENEPAPIEAAPPVDAGLANYEQALGKYLGPKLYEQVSKQVSFEKVSKQVDNLWDKALDGAAGLIGADGRLTDEQSKQLSRALVLQFGDLAEGFLAGSGAGLVDSLVGWSKDSPRQVALIALLAAAGAVAADAKLPALRQKLKISDGLDASLSASLGSLQNITLANIKGEISYQSTLLSATAEVEWDKEKGVGAGLELESKSLTFLGGDLALVGSARFNPYEQPNGQYENAMTVGAGAKWSRGDLDIGLNASHDERGDDKVMASLSFSF